MQEPLKNKLLSLLDLEQMPQDHKALKRAYTRKLKSIDQDKEAGSFQELRQAFEKLEALLKRQGTPQPKPVMKELTTQGRSQSWLPVLEAENPDDDQQANPENKEADPLSQIDGVDWETVVQLEHLITSLAPDDAAGKVISKTLQHAQMQYPEARSSIEYCIFSYLNNHLIKDPGGHPDFPDFVTPELLQELDIHFGWHSDIVSFQRRFAHAHSFTEAIMANIDYKPQSTNSKAKPKLSSFTLYILLYGLLILLINVVLYFFPLDLAGMAQAQQLASLHNQFCAGVFLIYFGGKSAVLAYGSIRKALSKISRQLHADDAEGNRTMLLFALGVGLFGLLLPAGSLFQFIVVGGAILQAYSYNMGKYALTAFVSISDDIIEGMEYMEALISRK